MKKRIVIWGIGLIILSGACLAGILLVEQPPVTEIESNRKILSEAETLNAEIYCHHLYNKARVQYDSAMIVWKNENERFIFWRSYEVVRTLIQKSRENAELAIVKATEAEQNTQKETREAMGSLRREMQAFEKLFVSLPLDRKMMLQHARGKLLLNEAEIAYERGDYNTGKLKSQEAAGLIYDAYQCGYKMLREYFRRLPVWQEQFGKIVEQSEKNRNYAIVIRKIPGDCSIYYKGKKEDSFPVEFGKNWLGDKCCEGDYATPEGLYYIVKRLQKPMTRYYKALLLDYPNAEDKIHFEKLKKAGHLSRNARPGSLIEIHGEGGRGGNWTNGCVALKNEDMAVLFRCVEKGSPVLIIGATEELKEI